MSAGAATRFIILCAARTGSTMLRLFLDSHPDACCHGEISAGLRGLVGVKHGRKYPIARKLDDLRVTDPAAFVRDYVLYAGDATAVGFKIKYDELVLPEYADILELLRSDPTIRVIHLRRTNLLKRFVSHVVALRSGITVVFDDAPLPTRERFVISAQECLENFELIRHREERFAALFARHPIHDVTYEQLVSQEPGPRVALQRFLGLDPAELTTPTQKINADSLEAILDNYDDLRRHFANTSYAAFFEHAP